MKKQIIFDEDIESVKKRLPKRCAYSTISEMLGGKYTPGTIRHMFAQRRTMSPVVLQAAQSLIEFITPDSTPESNTNLKN